MKSPLPIHAHEGSIVAAVRGHRQIIIQAPPGAGKSTQVPGFLIDAGFTKRIFVLQPRRLAARMLARRVAFERHGRVGGEIGHQVRFDSAFGDSTRVLFVTEGILLRRLIGDPLLNEASVVIFDEFHERHLDADLALASLLTIQEKRPDLKLVVMSATLDTGLLEKRMPEAALIQVEGRMFPVEHQFLPPKPKDLPIWEAASSALASVWNTTEGDALVFMPGGYEIRRTIQDMSRNPRLRGARILPLHGELPPAAQDAALEKTDGRKIVVATNVAETSLTIDGIRIVVDSGQVRVARYDTRRRLDTLYIEKTSRSSAEQRAGRAGRTASGLCLRLWSALDHEQRAAHDEPEIHRVDLAEPALLLAGLGVRRLQEFPWIEAPAAHRLLQAERLLERLEATEDGVLTATGRAMLKVPAHPRDARLLVEAARLGIAPLGNAAVAVLHGRGIWSREKSREVLERRQHTFLDGTDSDLIAAIRAWQFAARERYDDSICRQYGIDNRSASEIGRVFQQLQRGGPEAMEIAHPDPDLALMRALFSAYPDQVARRLDKGTFRCELSDGRRAILDKKSAARDAEWMLALEIAEIEGAGDLKAEIKMASALPLELVEEAASKAETVIEDYYDSTKKAVLRRESLRFEGLELRGKITERPDPVRAAELLAARVTAGDLRLEKWDESVEQWIARVNTVAAAMPEIGFPAIGTEE